MRYLLLIEGNHLRMLLLRSEAATAARAAVNKVSQEYFAVGFTHM